MKKVLCLLAVPFALASCHQTYEKTEALTAPYQAQTNPLRQPEDASGDTYATIRKMPSAPWRGSR